MLLAVRMEGGATSQGCGASRSWKSGEPVLPGASEGPALPKPRFSPVTPELDSDFRIVRDESVWLPAPCLR